MKKVGQRANDLALIDKEPTTSLAGISNVEF